MKKALITVLIIAQIFILCSCGSTGTNGTSESVNTPAFVPEVTPKPVATPTPEPTLQDMIQQSEIDVDHQNTVQNGATFALHDGWIYGQIFDSNRTLFAKTNVSTGEWVELDVGQALSVQVSGNYVYYVLEAPDVGDRGLYRMKTNGEGREKLSDAMGNMQVKGKYIYYTDLRSYDYVELSGKAAAAACHLYRMNLDGSSVSEIIDRPTFHFYVFNKLILFQDDFDGESLHIRNIDGTNDIKLNDEISYAPIYDGSYIYYMKSDSEWNSLGIWRMELDGSGDTSISPLPTNESFALYGDYIYSLNGDDNDTIYRVSKDGGIPEKIAPDKNCGRIQFLGDILKYTVFTADWAYIENNTFAEPDGSVRWEFKK